MVQESNLNFIFPIRKYVRLFVLLINKRNVYFLVHCYSFKRNFDKLFGSPKLGDIPNLFCQLYSGEFIEDEALESGSGVVYIVMRIG